MTTVSIYLTFNGNCREAFEFYKSVLGGEFPYVGTFGEMPPQEGMPPIPEDQKDRIMHVSLPISKETQLMGSDTIDGFGPAVTPGDNFAIIISPDSMPKADRIFKELSEGQSWNAYGKNLLGSLFWFV